MAYKEITLTEEEQKAGTGNFVKFEAIGAKFAGVFVKVTKRNANFNGREREVNDYTFKTKDGEFVLNAPFDLERKLRKAALRPGYKVAMVYTGDLPSEDPNKSAMKLFKVLVDDEIGPAAAAPKPPPPAPKPAAAPSAGSEFDDIPF